MSKYMQKYSIIIFKSKIDIRKNLFTKRKSLVRTQKPAVIVVKQRPSNCASSAFSAKNFAINLTLSYEGYGRWISCLNFNIKLQNF